MIKSGPEMLEWPCRRGRRAWLENSLEKRMGGPVCQGKAAGRR
jgi:hypothetical protein